VSEAGSKRLLMTSCATGRSALWAVLGRDINGLDTAGSLSLCPPPPPRFCGYIQLLILLRPTLACLISVLSISRRRRRRSPRACSAPSVALCAARSAARALFVRRWTKRRAYAPKLDLAPLRVLARASWFCCDQYPAHVALLRCLSASGLCGPCWRRRRRRRPGGEAPEVDEGSVDQ
jgi:hypothetical protein